MKKLLSTALFTLIVSLSLVKPCFSQEKVTMTNGNIFFVNIADTAGNTVKMQDPEAKKKEIVDIDKSRIFSITYANGNEVIIYKQDSLSEENYLAPEEMRSYIQGAHDAAGRYRSPLALWGSFGIGAASGIVLPAWIAPLTAGGGALFLGSRWIKINRSHVSDPKYLKDSNYISGYENTARQTRVQNVIKGAVAGLLLGAVARYTLLDD